MMQPSSGGAGGAAALAGKSEEPELANVLGSINCDRESGRLHNWQLSKDRQEGRGKRGIGNAVVANPSRLRSEIGSAG
jgi:hypothetical protein